MKTNKTQAVWVAALLLSALTAGCSDENQASGPGATPDVPLVVGDDTIPVTTGDDTGAQPEPDVSSNAPDPGTVGEDASPVECASKGTLYEGSPLTGDTAQGQSAISSYSCTAATADYSGNELVAQYVATCSGQTTFKVTNNAGAAGQALDLLIMTGCDGAACVAAGASANGEASVTFGTTQGVTYYVAVDGPSGDGASFTISVDTNQCCTPQCENKLCGDDGCGGSCGVCADTETCKADGQCAPACVTDCENKECGDDGCGSLCGTCPDNGTECNSSGLCIAPGVGCDDALTLGPLPFVGQGTNAGAGDDLDVAGGDCPQAANAMGLKSPDQAWALVAPVAGDYIVKLTSQFDGAIYVVENCNDAAGSCLAGSNDGGIGVAEALTVTLTANQAVFIIVDGAAGNAIDQGNYILEVSTVCQPQCTDKECGDDGCGGSCGACADGETCSANGKCGCIPDCVDKECGKNGCGGTCGECTNGLVCASGKCECTPQCDNKKCGDDGCGGDCGVCSEGQSCNDQGQCQCTPACDNKQCGPDNCGGSCGQCQSGQVCTPKGQCQGECVPNCDNKKCGDNGCGESCGECGDGEGCVSGQCVNQATCSGKCGVFKSGAPCQCDEKCFQFKNCCEDICTECKSTFEVQCCEPQCDGKQCGDDGCGGICGTCSNGQECSDVGQCETPCVPDCNGKTCGDDGCGGTCGTCPDGSTCNPIINGCVGGEITGCDSAQNVGALPYVVDGDTSAAVNDFSFANGECPGETIGWGGASNDDVYEFTAPADSDYQFQLKAKFDSALYVMTGCNDGACLGADEVIGSNKTETLTLSLSQDQTVYVVVDGFGNVSNVTGEYTLIIQSICVADCTNKTCGDDGCGGSCGTCGNITDVCSASGVCLSEGDLCDNAFKVNSVPFFTTGDTAEATPNYAYMLGQCSGETNGYGDGSSDHVYAFTPQDSGWYTFKLNPQYDSNLYLATDCNIPGDTCLAASESPGVGKTESIDHYLSANVTVFAYVDGWSNSFDIKGLYTLTIDETCFPYCEGKACGDDECGGSCGTCEDGQACSPTGQCVTEGSCKGFCGSKAPGGCWCDDKCNGIGDCCADFCEQCPNENPDFCCQPNCNGKVCGDDGCGGSCGECGENESCTTSGTCYNPKSCKGKCGGKAGSGCWCDDKCPALGDCCEDFCDQCEEVNPQACCEPSCDGKVCGDDGCGGTCGECAAGEACSDNGACEPNPNSCHKVCGVKSPGTCWCDTLCFQLGDCCEDACALCAEELPGYCP